MYTFTKGVIRRSISQYVSLLKFTPSYWPVDPGRSTITILLYDQTFAGMWIHVWYIRLLSNLPTLYGSFPPFCILNLIFGRGYHYHSRSLEVTTDVEEKRGRIAIKAWFYTRDGHIWKSWMWLANGADEWGVFVKILQNRQGAEKQNLHRFTGLYQFITRFSLRLDNTIANGFQAF